MKVIIFDFDDTLHRGNDWTNWGKFVEAFLTNEFNSNKKAVEFMKKHNITYLTNGQKIAKAMIDETGSANSFVKFQSDNIFPLTLETIRHVDGEKIKELSNHYKLYIVSNNTVKYIKHYLKIWKININSFVNIYQNNFFKSNATKGVIYAKILKQESVLPEESLVIGDNYKNDIVPALELGMNGYHVKSLEDVTGKIEELIKIKR